MTTFREAAAARGGQVRQRGDRPSKRHDENGRSVARAALTRINIREAAPNTSDLVGFDGHASVTETPYEMYDFFGPYTEVVSADAFNTTLNRADLDVPFVLGHDQMRRIARTTNQTLNLSMDTHGLQVAAELDPADRDVDYILPKLRSGLIDEMSFAFRIVRGQWSPDYTEYRIDEVDIHRGDVAIVGFGANPFTDAGVRVEAVPQAQLRARLALAIALGDS
jgi:uncharacterized protein